MAAVGEAGADRFRPHFLAIEWDDVVDAFKSGAAVVNSGTFHTPAHPHEECELPAASAMIYTDLTENLEAPHPERRPADLTGYLQTPRQLPRPPAGLSPDEHAAVGRLQHAGLPTPSLLVCAEDVMSGKPGPECYLKAAELLGVRPGDCVVNRRRPGGDTRRALGRDEGGSRRLDPPAGRAPRGRRRGRLLARDPALGSGKRRGPYRPAYRGSVGGARLHRTPRRCEPQTLMGVESVPGSMMDI